ncbi:MAG: homoserine O-succinyltransferase, partial [Lachnospirales bacterium]
KELEILSTSEESGLYIAATKDNRQIFVMGHSEYDTNTLKNEYLRDVNKGLSIDIPKHYFKDDDPNNEPLSLWKAHSCLLYTNWLNIVYQETPFDINEIKGISQ